MCGHGSITLLDGVEVDAKKLDEAVSVLAKSLIGRGRHATGLMYCNAKGRWHVEKAPVDAAEFNKGRAVVASDARCIAVHTRWATKGDPEWNKNNHPVAGPNGALVMHNGVVRDYSLKRLKGQPEVDTFVIAHTLGNMRKRTSREFLTSFAKRMVKVCGEIDGSMTLQLAFRETPLLVSTKIRSNPLYFAEAGGVRVTASTHEGVAKVFEALGIDIPTQSFEFTKQGKKGRVTKHVGTQRCIYEMTPGETLVWCDGQHAEFDLGVMEAKNAYKPAAQSTQPYVNTYQRPNVQSHIPGTAAAPAAQAKFKVGDRVKQKHTQRIGYVIEVEGATSPKMGLDWYKVNFLAVNEPLTDGSVTRIKSAAYTATITGGYLEAAPNGASQDPPVPTSGGETGRASSTVGVVSVAGEPTPASNDADAEVAPSTTLSGVWDAIVERFTRTDLSDIECEVCHDLDNNCRVVEDVLLCQQCQLVEWGTA